MCFFFFFFLWFFMGFWFGFFFVGGGLPEGLFFRGSLFFIFVLFLVCFWGFGGLGGGLVFFFVFFLRRKSLLIDNILILSPTNLHIFATNLPNLYICKYTNYSLLVHPRNFFALTTLLVFLVLMVKQECFYEHDYVISSSPFGWIRRILKGMFFSDPWTPSGYPLQPLRIDSLIVPTVKLWIVSGLEG